MTTTDTSTAANEQVRDQQRNVWNTFSGGWKKQDDFVFEWLRPVGAKLIEQVGLRDGYVVLDAATGTGEPGLSAAALVGSGRVIGTANEKSATKDRKGGGLPASIMAAVRRTARSSIAATESRMNPAQ